MERAARRTSGRVLSILFLIGISTTSHAAVREYFVAAEDVVWDYAPTGQNLLHCMDGAAPPCAIPEPWDASHVFNKVRYVQYTDATFTTPVVQPEWLGVLGPVIRAEVGDHIAVRFCNHASEGAYNMHPHGVRYNKRNEGAEYSGPLSGVGPGAGSRVEPGHCFTYQWFASQDSGPGPGDGSSKAWWYHSHIDSPAELNKGLLGPIIITAKGMAKFDATPKDVDREFVVAFFIFDELEGEEAGLMHAINGYIFGNLRGLVMRRGERVRWHVLGMGNEVDLHTPHWHGETVTIGAPHIARRTDVIELLPATMVTADMSADNPGEWLFHCHVFDHIHAGMSATYEIRQ